MPTATFRIFLSLSCSRHRRRVLHFGVTEHPGLGGFVPRSRTLRAHMLFYVSSSSLPPICFLAFRPQWSTHVTMNPKTRNKEHSYPISTILFSFGHTATPTALWVLMLRMKETKDKTTIETSSETVNTKRFICLKLCLLLLPFLLRCQRPLLCRGFRCLGSAGFSLFRGESFGAFNPALAPYS